MNVLYITNIPSPYKVDFFNELGKYCNLTGVFERKAAKNRDKKWRSDIYRNFKPIFLNGKELGDDLSISLQIFSLLKDSYDIIVLGGYSSPTYALAIEYMVMKGIPFLLNADGGFIKDDKRAVYLIKRHLISRASAWLSTGKITDKYLIHYGADAERIFRYPFTSVTKSWLKCVDIVEKKKIKEILCIPEQKIIISVGQFIYRKGMDLLIQCAEKIRSDTGIYIIGGKASEKFIGMVKSKKCEHVHFLPFMEKEKLRMYYLAADIFVFPTREDIWGLVLNEAMACGVPCVASKHSIAANEMIEEGLNGYLVNPADAQEMCERINYLLENEKLCLNMGHSALETAHEYTIEAMAIRHMEIFNEILKCKIYTT